jgi:WD40 repeat protein
MAQSTNHVQHVNAHGQSKVQIGNIYYNDSNHDRCIADLRLTDPRKDKERIQDTKGGLLRDSYKWILDHPDFQRWRDDDHSRLLWIKGDPGKGKTMLLIGIVDELERQRAQLKQADQSTSHATVLSYFFCQATNSDLNSATAVLRGLIYLLVEQKPSLAFNLREKYKQSGSKLFEGENAFFALSDILSGMLQDPSLDGAILIIDALDECETNRHRLLDFITKPYRVKWIVSSRNWPDIEEKLDNAEQKVRLQLELNEDSISAAVDTYIRRKVDDLAGLKNYDKETRDAVENHLTSNADGTFLWVALVYQELASPDVRTWHTRDLLKSFPPGLNSLYDRMMGHISGSRDASRCKEVLAVVSMVYRPITLDELKVLAKLLGSISKDYLEGIVGSCGSFLTLREGVIYFVHQSAKDFLLKASHQILLSGAAHKHHAIFSRSLAALSETLQRDIYGLRSPGYPADRVSLPDPDPLASIRYSCVYWVDHLGDSNPTERIGDNNDLQDGGVVDEFIRKKYLYWLESLSLLRSLSEGVMAVNKLGALVVSCYSYGYTGGGLIGLQGNTEARQLAELLRDARRFILSHRPAIEIAPLQIYASALVFSPEHSLVRQLFKNEAPDWIIVKPRMEADWNACLDTLKGHGDSVMSVVFSVDGQRLASGSHDWTVKIWDAATGACVRTLKGHGYWVASVVFSADGQRLASGSSDRTVKIWDAATGAEERTLKDHDDWVTSVVFSADSQRLASGSHDETVKIWDAATGACMRTLKGHGGSVASVVFSADGQRLASGSSDETVKIWDAATGAGVRTLKDHDAWVTSVVFSADGQRLASGSSDRTVKIWDAATGAGVWTLKDHDDSVTSVVFSADGQRLASGSSDGTVKIWDAATGACMRTLKGHGGSVTSVVFSADGQRLASGSSDRTVKIWDAAMGAGVQTLKGHGGSVASVVFSADGQRLASALRDITVKIWDAATGAGVRTLKDHDDWVTSVVFSADGQRLASGSSDGTVKIWDAAMGAGMRTLKGHGGSVASVVFSADGQRLASGSSDMTVKIWDAATGAEERTLKDHDDWVTSVVFSADGQRLASGSSDGTVKIWDAATGACMQTLKGHGGSVALVVFSADGQRLASGSSDRTVKIWDAATGAEERTLKDYDDSVTSVVFSADGQRLASALRDMTVKIWDAATGAGVRTLKDHDAWVTSVVFSADGQRLASGSRDGTVKIWDAATGACMRTLKGHGGWVTSVVFSADGQRLASGSSDMTVKIWDAATGAGVRTLKDHDAWVTSVVFSADGQRLASGSSDGTVKIWDAATGAEERTLDVGRNMAHLSFDPTTDSRLFTDIGCLNLDLSPAMNNQLTETASRGAYHSGYGISTDGLWIVQDGEKMLWLPAEYRPSKSAVIGAMVAVACDSGRVLVMKFS